MKVSRRKFIKGSLAATSAMTLTTLQASRANAASIDAAISFPSLEILALNRLTMGLSPQSLLNYRMLGNTPKKQFQHFLESQLAPASLADQECEVRLQKEGFSTLHKSYRELYADHVVAADAMKDEKKQLKTEMKNGEGDPKATLKQFHEVKKDENQLRLQPLAELESATWIRAVYSQRQLHETITDFWHNHFSIYAWDGKMAPLFASFDREVIRKCGLGNFREFLESVAKHPAMLLYLDNTLNQSGNPNENYARELFELHTLGAENYLGTQERNKVPGYKTGHPIGYVDGDVYEAARCFTGWRIDQGGNSGNTGEFSYFEPWHDRFQKIVLGTSLKEYQPPLKDGHDILDLLAEHPGTARFIARKVCRRFITDNPPEVLVARVAKVFHDNRKSHDQLKKTFYAAFFSPEFQMTWGQKLKRPFETIAGLLRATEAEFSPTDQFIKNFERTGHRSFQWRTPDGFPDVREKWATTNSLLERWRFTNQLLAGNISGVKIELKDKALSPETVQTMARRYLGRPLEVSVEKNFASLLAENKNADRRLQAVAALIFMSPDYQWK